MTESLAYLDQEQQTWTPPPMRHLIHRCQYLKPQGERYAACGKKGRTSGASAQTMMCVVCEEVAQEPCEHCGG